jgi:diguanylate cyclase
VKTDLAKIIAAGEMDVWYQPQVAARSLRIAGFEALARWNHPTLGQLTPDAFLDDADDSLADLAAFVLSRACEDATRWPAVTVSVNIAPRQFADENFPDEIGAIAAWAGLPLDRLELEILESAAFEDPDAARAGMSRLRAMGVRLAIDDYGQGFSRQSLLLDLPVNKIKLARSIVIDERSAGWIGEFVSTAHALGMEVTAEGVETQAQAQAMQAAGCDYLQGYFFARPSSGADVTRALAGGAGQTF